MTWYLGRVRESDPGSGAKYDYEACREIPDDEMERIRHSIALVVRLSPRALLMPLLIAANELRGRLVEFQDNPAIRGDFDHQVARAVALDHWLNALPLFDYRLKRETRLVLGEDAEVALRERLRHARENTLALRVSWLFRNAGQHAISPIEVLAVNGKRDEHGKMRRQTVLDVDKWRRLHGADFPRELASLPASLDYFEVIRSTVDACNQIMSHFLVDNAEPREAASQHIIEVIGEALVYFDETSHVMIWQQQKGTGESWDWQFVELPWTYAGEVIASTDGARAGLGLPKRWTHLTDDEGRPVT